MITKIKKRFGRILHQLEESRIRPNLSRQTTKISLSQLTTGNNRSSIDNDYVGIRFKNQRVSIDDNIGMEKLKQSASVSTMSTIIEERKIEN